MNAFDGLNFSTPEGSKLKEMLQQRLQELREQNDSQQLDFAQTCALRGEIRLIKRLLQPPATVVKTPGYNHDMHGGDRK